MAGVLSPWVHFWAALAPSQAGLGVSLYAWSDLLFLSSLQRPSPRRSNSPDKFKRPTPPPSPNTQTPVQPPPPPPPPPMQPAVPSAATSQPAPSQHSVHPSSQP